MDRSSPQIYVAGHRGMVGSAIVHTLLANGVAAHHIMTRIHAELNRTDQRAVNEFFAIERQAQAYLAAAKLGGIHANKTYPAEFIYQNLIMQANVLHAAHVHGVQKPLFFCFSCIYLKLAPRPMAESALLAGSLEPTNEPYAVAKIAGIKQCESYSRQYGRDNCSAMHTNLYGPGDILKIAASFPRCCAASTRPSRRMRQRESSEARERRGGNSCTWTTWLLQVCLS